MAPTYERRSFIKLFFLKHFVFTSNINTPSKTQKGKDIALRSSGRDSHVCFC
jgi:hypothetical protein